MRSSCSIVYNIASVNVISSQIRRIRYCSREHCAWTWIHLMCTRTNKYGERWSTLISKSSSVNCRLRCYMSVKKVVRISGKISWEFLCCADRSTLCFKKKFTLFVLTITKSDFDQF